MRSIVVLTLTLLFPGAFALGATPVNLTLKETLQKGMAFSVEVQKAESQKREAEADYRSTRSYLFPSLDLKSAAGRQKSTSAYRTSFAGAIGEVETYRAYLQLSQPLYQGGAVSSGLRAARLSTEVQEQRVFEARQNYAFDLIEAYLKASQTQLQLELARENRNILKDYFRVTSSYASIGRSKNIDRLTAEASYNLSEAEVLNAESEAERALQDLFRLTGLEPSAQVSLQKEIPLPSVDAKQTDELVRQALQTNPEVRALQLEVEREKSSSDVLMAEFRPKLTLDGIYGYDSPDEPKWFTPRSEYYSVYLNLTIPLFDGLRSFSQKDINRENVYQKQRDLEQKRLQVRESVAKAVATLSKEFDRLKLTQTAADGARKAMSFALRDYRNGLLSSLDVLNIQRTRYDADRQYTNARLNYNQQVLTLRRDLGVDLEKTYSVQ